MDQLAAALADVVPPELLGPLGFTIGLILAVVFLAREHQRADRAMEVDRNYWRDLALRGAALADNATTVALRKTDG